MVDVGELEELRVAALRGLGLLDTPPEERFDRVVRLAQRLFDVPTVAITLVDTDRLFLKASLGAGPTSIPRAQSFCTAAIAEPVVLVVEDASRDPRFSANPHVVGGPRLRFFAGQPLIAAGGYRIGTLCLADQRPRSFTVDDQDLLRDLARWVENELIIEAELERAAEVQAGLLPQVTPALAGYQIAGGCHPTRAVGGDFYDWYLVPGGVAFTLADVWGQGLGAAIIAASVRAVLRVAARRHGDDGALAEARLTLEPDLVGSGSTVTAFHGHLDVASGYLSYSDAGHGLTLLVHADGSSRRLPATGPPLGVLGDVGGHPVTRLPLLPGDLVVTVSDGVLDGSADVLGGVADAVRGACSAQDAVDRVMRLGDSSGRRSDDATVVAVRRDP